MQPWLEERCKYFPTLHVSPADLNALEFLPPTDGRYLCPVVPLQPWVGSQTLEKAVRQVRTSIHGKRETFIADISDNIQPKPGSKKRPVHDELAALARPDDECKAWRDFISAHPEMVPVIQTPQGLTAKGLAAQIATFTDLGRGMVLRLRLHTSEAISQSIELAKVVAKGITAANDLMVIADFGRIREETLPAILAISAAQQIANVLNGGDAVAFTTSGTSFPLGFTHISGDGEETILERRLFNLVNSSAALEGLPIALQYGDYGSARVRVRNSGGGDMPARVDYATKTTWHFNRRNDENRDDDAYIAAARKIMGSSFFDHDLNIFGSKAIRKAAEEENVDDLGDQTKVTRVRINLHLHAQAHYWSSRAEFLAGGDDDQPWVD